MRSILVAAIVTSALFGCNEDETRPYLEFAGGGFIFNYRTADAFYGFVARPVRPIPEGAIIEAELEMPGKTAPYKITEKATSGQLQYSFKSPPITGIAKDHHYQVVLRVIDSQGKELGRYSKTFHTDVDQATMPDKPLVSGPGYKPNPEIFAPAEAPKP